MIFFLHLYNIKGELENMSIATFSFSWLAPFYNLLFPGFSTLIQYKDKDNCYYNYDI